MVLVHLNSLRAGLECSGKGVEELDALTGRIGDCAELLEYLEPLNSLVRYFAQELDAYQADLHFVIVRSQVIHGVGQRV